MTSHVKLLIRSILDAARGTAGDGWSEAQAFADMELRMLARTAGHIERLLRERRIDETRARELFDIHCVAARTALASVEAITAATAEGLVNAATAVIGKAIERRLGITII